VATEQLRRDVEHEDLRRTAAWNRRYRYTSAALLTLLCGFIVIYLNIEFDFLARVTPFIIGGTLMTIIVSLCSIVLATILALLGAIGRLSNSAIGNAVASFYVSFFRGTPLLLQLLFG
jgi:polar amino acid transport system permease protein